MKKHHSIFNLNCIRQCSSNASPSIDNIQKLVMKDSMEMDIDTNNDINGVIPIDLWKGKWRLPLSNDDIGKFLMNWSNVEHNFDLRVLRYRYLKDDELSEWRQTKLINIINDDKSRNIFNIYKEYISMDPIQAQLLLLTHKDYSEWMDPNQNDIQKIKELRRYLLINGRLSWKSMKKAGQILIKYGYLQNTES